MNDQAIYIETHALALGPDGGASGPAVAAPGPRNSAMDIFCPFPMIMYCFCLCFRSFFS